MVFNQDKWSSSLIDDAHKYQQNSPYPHIVMDYFLLKEVAEKTLEVFPNIKDEGWIHYVHVNERKHGLNKLELIPDFIKNKVIAELNSQNFIEYLEKLTGIDNLLPDHTFEGGGIHQSEQGGYLNIHADFTVHPHKKNWRRRVNLLIYLNKDWEEHYGGNLELWDKTMSRCMQKIPPIFNRAVIFNTDADSYHGLPDPLMCPKGITRKSIALYYFTEEQVGSFKKRTTNYKARPDDGYKAIFIWLDKKFILIYTLIKGALNLNDDFASKILNKLGKRKK